MSFHSVDSDDFGLFSSRSCSPSIDNATQQFNSLEYGSKDDTKSPQNSAALVVNDRSLYQTMFMSDLVSKDETSKVENSVDVNSIERQEWTLSDFISTPNTSCQSNLLSYEAVSPPKTTHSVTVSWDTSENSTVPLTVSWNTSITSSVPVTVTYSTLGTISAEDLGDESSLLQGQDEENFTDAYDRVSFDGPTQQPDSSFSQSASRFTKKSFNFPSLLSTSKMKEPEVGIQNINNQCYEAAISEYFGRKKHSRHGKYIAKLKNSKPHSIAAQVYDKLQRGSPGQSPIHKQSQVQKQKSDQAETSVASPAVNNENMTKDESVTKTTFTTFTTPSIPSPVSPYSTHSHSPGQADGQKSPKSPKGETEVKKYRYNQTALALQQSGLMKTTIKTAELLRKSRLLQQELSKLRKETSIFVHMVLNNPENKHLKEMYMSQNNQLENNSNSQ